MRVVTVIPSFPFRGAVQAIQITQHRKRPDAETWSKETVYAITALTAEWAVSPEIAAILRRRWAIENELHWVATSSSAKTHHASAPARDQP